MEDINGIKTFNNIPYYVKDMFSDIGAGICYAQKVDSASMKNSTFDLSKVKQYKPKTEIPQIIQDALSESEYRKEYEWQYDKGFTSDGVKFEVIKYDINTSDWCLVLMDGKEVKMTKKNLREWWEERK